MIINLNETKMEKQTVKFKDLSGWIQFWIVLGAITSTYVVGSFLIGFAIGFLGG